MNNSELETLIRNILREQLAPATQRMQRNAIFQTVDEAVCAAHQALRDPLIISPKRNHV